MNERMKNGVIIESFFIDIRLCIKQKMFLGETVINNNNLIERQNVFQGKNWEKVLLRWQYHTKNIDFFEQGVSLITNISLYTLKEYK